MGSGSEFRVPMMLPGAVLTPIGLLLYGWAAQAHLHWSVVDLGGFIVSFGLQLFGQGKIFRISSLLR